MSTNKKIITVFCATGRQGSGAVKLLVEDGTYAVRAVTRNPESAASKDIAAKGVELVKADLNDRDSVLAAVKGSYGVIGITDFWTADGKEEQQGYNIVDAAKAANVKHMTWSTLYHSDLKVPHWETKANVDDYLKASGVPRTSVYTSWFWENIGAFVNLQRDSKGELFLDVSPAATDGPIPCMAGEDVGAICAVALLNPKKYIGQDIKAVTSVTTPREIAKSLEEIVGEKINIKELSMKEFEESKATAWPELWLNYKWFYLNYKDSQAAIPGALAVLPQAKGLKDIIILKGGKDAILPK
ncbi:hypothetical protein C8J56DRAFT_1072978 [Mycena floridula]|nr:hypothetical protein C8J56DRAFT_1072978 [Mycena floridula]